MKKQFEFMLILLLTYAFISCSAFVGFAHAGEKSASPSLGQSNLIRTVLQAIGKADALPDFNIEFPTTITELIDYVTNLELVQQMKETRQGRVEKRTTRIQDLRDKWPFGGGQTK